MNPREIAVSMDLTGGDRSAFNAKMDEAKWVKEREVTTMWWRTFAAGTSDAAIQADLERAVQVAADESSMTATVVVPIGEKRVHFVKRPLPRLTIVGRNRTPRFNIDDAVRSAGFWSGVAKAQARSG